MQLVVPKRHPKWNIWFDPTEWVTKSMCYFLVVLTRAAQISKGWFKLALTSVTWSSQFKEMNLRWLQWSQQVLKLVDKRTRDEQ
jgi:hypothetical protein